MRQTLTLDPVTTNPIQPCTKQSLRKEIHHLVEELKTTDLAPHRQQEIVAQMQRLLDQIL
jgi:hypothetical protein